MFPSSVSLTAVNNALSLLHFTGRCSAKSLTTVPVPFRNKARSSCSVPQQSALVMFRSATKRARHFGAKWLE
jgi:hypothetical protein